MSIRESKNRVNLILNYQRLEHKDCIREIRAQGIEKYFKIILKSHKLVTRIKKSKEIEEPSSFRCVFSHYRVDLTPRDDGGQRITPLNEVQGNGLISQRILAPLSRSPG